MIIFYLLMQMVAGILGGQLAGRFYPTQSLGRRGNTLTGIIGGAITGQVLASWGMGVADHEMNLALGGIILNFFGSAAGGGIITLLLGGVKGDVSKN